MSEPQRSNRRRLKSNADLKASNTNVVQQAKLMDSAGTAWHAVKYGKLELIMKLFPSQCDVYNKGPVGENVFHVAMLLNTPSTLAIAKYLVKLYGATLVNTPYQERRNENDHPGHYEGETAIHIAIVNKDFDMVKFLVQNSANVRARAYGQFFQEGSVVYYGEYPLSFAACTGQKDIVSYLKRHGARVNGDKDASGNTALHMCVHHDQIDMFDHLVEYCGASEHVCNNRGQTPLLLAASLGKQEIFQHIYNKRRKVAWAYGPVTSYSLSLHEIDTVQSSLKFVPSALEQIVRKAHMEILSDPLIKTLLETKWARFAAFGFMLEAFLYTSFVILQTFLIWLHCDAELWNTTSRLALEIVIIIFACCFFLLEILDVHMWTVGVYNRQRFMRSNSTHKPPLYPIPGDVQASARLCPKPTFMSRIMKTAIAEGVEGQRVDPASFAMAHAPPQASSHSLSQYMVHRSPEANNITHHTPYVGSSHLSTRFSGGSATSYTGSAKLGNAEAGLLPVNPPSGAPPPPPLFVRSSSPGPIGEGVERPPTPPHPRNLSTSHPPTRMNSPGPIAEADQAKPPLPLPMPGLPPISYTAPTADPSPPSLPPIMAHTKVHGNNAYTQGSLDVDIVSVGLAGLHGSLPTYISDSFQQPAVTTMLGGNPNPSRPDMSYDTAKRAGQGNESLLGIKLPPSGGTNQPFPPRASDDGSISRANSTEISGEKTEIKNRIRGGGGGDMAKGGRAEGGRKVPGKDDKDDVVEEDTQPMYVEGVLGAIKTTMHATHGYYMRMLCDPITLVMRAHILLTLVHFITWAATYGGVDGAGPSSSGTKQFDDIVLSLVGLTGWMAILYFMRGHKAMGQLCVILEYCVFDLLKFSVLFFIADISFTLAFYAVINGTTYTTDPNSRQPVSTPGSMHPPFSNIGYGMIQVIRFLYGEADYDSYSDTAYHSKKAFATIYFILYVFLVVFMLAYLLIAMIMHTFNSVYGHAENVQMLRWASYVMRLERRMPLRLQQRFRLGGASYDPQLQMRVFNHVFEVVDDSKGDAKDNQIKALETMLDKMKKKKGQ